jgi:cysteinyl-tRNA synthetase
VVARHHYRSAIDISDKLFRDNLNALLEFHRLFERVLSSEDLGTYHALPECEALIEQFELAMDNDFNSPEALVALEQERSRIVAHLDKGGAITPEVQYRVKLIKDLGHVLGLFFDSLEKVEQEGLRIAGRVAGTAPMTPDSVSALIGERVEVRAAKNFARSDEIRKILNEHGVDVLDSKSGSSWRFA